MAIYKEEWKEQAAGLIALARTIEASTPEQRSALVHRVTQWCQEALPHAYAPLLVDLFKGRSSIREYEDKPIAESILHWLKEAAVHAATSRNQQGRRFVFVQNQVARQKLVSHGGMQPFVAQAPLVIAGIATSRSSQGAVADVLISLTQLEAVAISAGLGTCWLGIFEEEAVHQLLDLPDHWRLAMMMSVGHYRGVGSPRPKLRPDEMIWQDSYAAPRNHVPT